MLIGSGRSSPRFGFNDGRNSCDVRPRPCRVGALSRGAPGGDAGSPVEGFTADATRALGTSPLQDEFMKNTTAATASSPPRMATFFGSEPSFMWYSVPPA